MKSIAEFFEREGGQIALLSVLMLTFAYFAFIAQSNTPFFDKIAASGFGMFGGALIMVMKGNGNGKHAVADPQPTQPTEPPKEP